MVIRKKNFLMYIYVNRVLIVYLLSLFSYLNYRKVWYIMFNNRVILFFFLVIMKWIFIGLNEKVLLCEVSIKFGL